MVKDKGYKGTETVQERPAYISKDSRRMKRDQKMKIDREKRERNFWK